MKIFSLIIVGFILLAPPSLFADEVTSASASDDASGWVSCKDSRITLVYPSDTNLKKLESRLRSRYFSVSASEKDLFANPKYSIENRIIARLEAVLLRVKQILAMDPEYMEIKIKVFRNRSELSDEYFQLFGTTGNYKSFYVHSLGTIYSSMQDISDSVISHEMSHAVMDNYFKVMPPEKTAELLATYVDSHLERE